MLFSAAVVALALLFIGGALIYPYIIPKLSQRRAVKRLIKDAKSMGYKHKKFYKNIFAVRNLSYKYDVVIYNETDTYAIKLWNAKHSSSVLVLTDGGKVFERRRALPVMDTSKNKGAQIKERAKGVSKTRLPKRFSKKEGIREILLVYPSYSGIVYEGKAGKVSLNVGDELFDKELFSPAEFAAELRYAIDDKSNVI